MSAFTPPGEGNGQSLTWLPAVDVWETEAELVLSFDLPGVAEDKIAVELDNDVLTVSGERERTNEHSSERFYRFERRYGQFCRSISLPAAVKEEDVHEPERHHHRRITIGRRSQCSHRAGAARTAL